MAGILQQGGYVDPRAAVLNAPMTNKYTPQQIRDYIKTNNLTEDQILSEAVSRGLSKYDVMNAMSGVQGYDQPNVDKFINSRGILFDKTPDKTLPDVTPAPAVTPRSIAVTPNQTVQGQLKTMLDPNSPLMQQAATMGASYANKRGLLNSSIGASAAQDAMIRNAMPAAQQDAGTFYDANKTDSSNQLQAGMFNADQVNKLGMFNVDQSSRLGMFNAGLNKDNQQFNQKLEFDKWAANLDADNRLKLANIEAMSRDTGVMADVAKTYMSIFQEAGFKDFPPDKKTEIMNRLTDQYNQVLSLMPSFEGRFKNLNFAPNQGSNPIDTTKPVSSSGGVLGSYLPTNSTGSSGASSTRTGSIKQATEYVPAGKKLGDVGTAEPNKTGDGYILNAQVFTQGTNGFKNGTYKPVKIDTRDYQISGTEKLKMQSFLLSKGWNIDVNDIVPSDITSTSQDNNQYGYGLVGNLSISDFMVPFQPPGTKRTDSPMFWMWAPAMSKYA